MLTLWIVLAAASWVALVVVAHRPRDASASRTLAWMERARDEALFGLGVVVLCASFA